jgi:quaternary ammonium compound-resistance protein SugE
VPWALLIAAGLLETGWAIGIHYTHGFTRPIPSILTGVGIAGSMLLLSIAARSIPIGTAYGVWVGIGAIGTVVVGVVVLSEPISFARAAFVVLMLIAIIGLKFTSDAG